jgi:hypothetical protein
MNINPTVLSILHNQDYSNFNIHCQVSDYDFENPEHVFIYYDKHRLHFFGHKEASYVIKVRLNIMLSYIQSYFYTRKPNAQIGFILGLGDSDEKSNSKNIPIISFTKKSNINNILIPNVDFFTGTIHTHLTDVNRYDIDFNSKIDGSCFAGSSTGLMNGNKRVRYCLSRLNKNNHLAKITGITQGTLGEWQSVFPDIESIIDNNYCTIQNQLHYKIVANIDGNTLCYSRLYWQILSNSAVVYIEPDTTYTQFFDTDKLSKFYFISSIEEVDNVYNYILDNNNRDIINKMNLDGQKYLKDCFDGYLLNKEQFLSNILVYVLDRLIESNNNE